MLYIYQNQDSRSTIRTVVVPGESLCTCCMCPAFLIPPSLYLSVARSPAVKNNTNVCTTIHCVHLNHSPTLSLKLKCYMQRHSSQYSRHCYIFIILYFLCMYMWSYSMCMCIHVAHFNPWFVWVFTIVHHCVILREILFNAVDLDWAELCSSWPLHDFRFKILLSLKYFVVTIIKIDYLYVTWDHCMTL